MSIKKATSSKGKPPRWAALRSSSEGTASVGTAERARFWSLVIILTIALVVSITLAIIIGPVEIPALRVWQIAFGQMFPNLDSFEWTNAEYHIVWLIRFPRVLMGVFVGAGLAVVGVTMQALVRNPLADPYLLGVSSGASTGAVIALSSASFLAFAGIHAISLGAFLGALLALTMTFFLAQNRGRISPQRLILSGMAVAYLFSGMTSFITLTSSDRDLARAALSWMLGTLSGTDWPELTLPAVVLLIGTFYLILQARSLNALIIGEETAAALGVDTNKFRLRLFLIVSILTAVMVAVSGAIGFVGLMIPHIVRIFVGSDHRRVLPISMLFGAIFVIWVDVFARIVIDPNELPIGVVTSLIGAPFFLWLMRSKTRAAGRRKS